MWFHGRGTSASPAPGEECLMGCYCEAHQSCLPFYLSSGEGRGSSTSLPPEWGDVSPRLTCDEHLCKPGINPQWLQLHTAVWGSLCTQARIFLSFAKQTVSFLITAFTWGRWIYAPSVWLNGFPLLGLLSNPLPNLAASLPAGFPPCSCSSCPSDFILLVISLLIYWWCFRRRQRYMFSVCHI